MRSRLLVAALLAALLFVPAPARSLQIVSHIEGYDPATSMFYFLIQLNAPPDFFTVDGVGRPRDSFQYWICWDSAAGWLRTYTQPDVLIRGGEIRTLGGIPVRDRTGTPSGPGGWGPVRGIVPYTLTGSIIQFQVPRPVLGCPGNQFYYYLGVTEYGGTTSSRDGVSGQPGPVPTTTATWGRLKTLFR